MQMKFLFTVILDCAIIAALNGCRSAVVSSATATGGAAAQERSIGRVLDDATIYTEIQHLFFQSDVNDLLMNVTARVREGRVLLIGKTRNHATSVEAVRLAWEAQGVREVINEIEVTEPDPLINSAEDYWIETQIEARLLATRGIRSINYTIECSGGVVYVLGIGQNEQEVRDVMTIASQTKGVKKVISYVRLKGDPKYPPQAI
ncbi:MAG: BON domain-containing protein [Anaerolineae bacterium]|nr:BON domain-containing protein [Anaerolineae bacterium]